MRSTRWVFCADVTQGQSIDPHFHQVGSAMHMAVVVAFAMFSSLASFGISGSVGSIVEKLPASSTLGSSTPTTTCSHYNAGAGIYFSTYGGPLSATEVSQDSIGLLDAVLGFPWVHGVAHYQNWSTLEIADNVFNWTVLDAVFAAASRHGKRVVLGLQAGVCAPEWLLDDVNVQTARLVIRNSSTDWWV